MKVEWLILADAAQVVGGKLYLLGGGWNRITANKGLPLTRRIAVAFAVYVPWSDTNQRQPFEIEILDGEGNSLGKANGQLEVGRPPGVPPGLSQLAQMAVNIDLKIERTGTYEVVARLINVDERRASFHVVSGTPSVLQQAC